jgi:hypothetical protein
VLTGDKHRRNAKDKRFPTLFKRVQGGMEIKSSFVTRNQVLNRYYPVRNSKSWNSTMIKSKGTVGYNFSQSSSLSFQSAVVQRLSRSHQSLLECWTQHSILLKRESFWSSHTRPKKDCSGKMSNCCSDASDVLNSLHSVGDSAPLLVLEYGPYLK